MARVLDKRVVNRGLDMTCDGADGVPAAEAVIRRYATSRFGLIDVDLDLVIEFNEGLIGFETCRRYVVVRHDDTSAFRWLQSLDEPAVAFPIVEPSVFRPDYAPTISDADARVLSLRHDTPTLLFAVVAVPEQNPRGMTANLLAPLVINGELRQGKQVIVQDEGFTTRHEVVKELERTALMAALEAAGSLPAPNPTGAGQAAAADSSLAAADSSLAA
jgi:flagellar assembly factor FliW